MHRAERAVSRTSGPSRLGLVLSGGGAKGAYEVGVVAYLADCGVRVHMLSGASIGSLNAAVVSVSPDLVAAARTLRGLWAAIAARSPLEVDTASIGLELVMAL